MFLRYLILIALFFVFLFQRLKYLQDLVANIPDATFFGPSAWTNFYLNVNSVGAIDCDLTVRLNISHNYTDV